MHSSFPFFPSLILGYFIRRNIGHSLRLTSRKHLGARVCVVVVGVVVVAAWGPEGSEAKRADHCGTLATAALPLAWTL